MKVVIIGAGNVATHMAKALKAIDVEVAQIWSYHYENASLLAKEVNSVAIQSLEELNHQADLCLISIKDDEISNIANQLQSFKGIVAHTSGSVNMSVLANFENFGVFYPLQTFSKIKHLDFRNVPLCIEANKSTTLSVLQQLAQKLSVNVAVIGSDKRKILHLAAVFACNFTNHLYALADGLLKANDLNFDMMKPLINETANKIQSASPVNVQTGPAIRNDHETIRKHEELLFSQPNMLEIYKTLSKSIKKTR